MRIGRLRNQISILEERTTPDEMGGTTRTWEPIADVWASVQPISGREFFQAQQIQSSITHKITLRHVAVSASNRIEFEGRQFDIHAVLDSDERHQWLTIMAEELLS